jgi:threonine dehydratase
MAGIAFAAESLAPHMSIIGVQSVMHPTMPEALRGEFPTFRGTTLAEGIAAKRPGRLACELIRKCVDDIVLVDDARLEHGVGLLLSHEKTVTEGAGAGAGAAGFAAVLAQPERYRGRKIGLILSGGNIDPGLLASVIMREPVRDKCILTLRLPVADRPGALSRITHVIGQHGGIVLQVFHRRLSLDAPARFATLEIAYEAPDPQNARCIADELKSAGIEFLVVPG